MTILENNFMPGHLVRARGREWVVQSESRRDWLRLRPLGGADNDTIALIPAACRLRWTSQGLALLAILIGIWIVNSDHQPVGWWTYRLDRWWIYLPTLGLALLALLALYQSAAARADEPNPPPAC